MASQIIPELHEERVWSRIINFFFPVWLHKALIRSESAEWPGCCVQTHAQRFWWQKRIISQLIGRRNQLSPTHPEGCPHSGSAILYFEPNPAFQHEVFQPLVTRVVSLSPLSPH